MTDTSPTEVAPSFTSNDPIPLIEPIRRGDTEITRLQIRKPKGGELRGLSLQDVLSTDITALLTLIPRISEPPLTADEANDLDPADLTEIGGKVRGFFMTAGERKILEQLLAEQPQKT